MAMHEISYEDRDGVIWMNGSFVPWREAKIHVLNHALHYASAVFEGMRAYNGEVFELTAHNERLHASADILGFAVPYTAAELDQACRETLSRSGFADPYLPPERTSAGSGKSVSV